MKTITISGQLLSSLMIATEFEKEFKVDNKGNLTISYNDIKEATKAIGNAYKQLVSNKYDWDRNNGFIKNDSVLFYGDSKAWIN